MNIMIDERDQNVQIVARQEKKEECISKRKNSGFLQENEIEEMFRARKG